MPNQPKNIHYYCYNKFRIAYCTIIERIFKGLLDSKNCDKEVLCKDCPERDEHPYMHL